MSRKRAVFLQLSVLSVWLIIAFRLFWLSVWSVPPWASDGFASKTEIVYGPRGNIYDRNGEPLVMNEKVYDLYLDAYCVKEGESGARIIYEKLKPFAQQVDGKKISFEEISNAVKSGSRYYKLGITLTQKEVEIVKGSGIRGIGYEPKVRRVYPEGELARDLLGICGIDGRTGIEYVFDKHLRGKPFRVARQRDGAGRNINENFYTDKSIKGGDIYLTIDKNIQFIAECAARDAVLESGANKVIIIVQDPNSGEVLAMTSKEASGKDKKEPIGMNIRAISEVYEPGSTFKTFTYAIALADYKVKDDELIFCENGKYKIYSHTINDHEKKSFLTARQAFAYSSNIACAKISQRIQKEKMIDSLRDFGFWSKTGITLPGEEKGLFPKSNDPFTFMTVSFGQGIGVTPLQLVNAYSAIANGGWLLEPQIVLKISSSEGQSDVLKNEEEKKTNFLMYFAKRKKNQFSRKVIRQVIADSKVIESIKDMLGDVVKYGTGKLSAVDGYIIGGKTGTAQKIDKRTGKYSSTDYVASFCGILPLENPRLTVLAIVDSPSKGDYWGGSVAAPLFARVAGQCAAYLRIPPSKQPSHSEGELVSAR